MGGTKWMGSLKCFVGLEEHHLHKDQQSSIFLPSSFPLLLASLPTSTHPLLPQFCCAVLHCSEGVMGSEKAIIHTLRGYRVQPNWQFFINLACWRERHVVQCVSHVLCYIGLSQPHPTITRSSNFLKVLVESPDHVRGLKPPDISGLISNIFKM